MKTFFTIVVLLHGALHLLAFVKAFGIKEISELTLPVSKPMGMLWLLAAMLFLLYTVLYITGMRASWVPGLIAICVSQVLIIFFWQDARFGTLPNILILLVAAMACGSHLFDRSMHREIRTLLTQVAADRPAVTDTTNISNLPSPVRNWLVRSGATRRPGIRTGRISQTALIRTKPTQRDWYAARAIQYTTIYDPAFIWSADVRMNRFLWFLGRDKFAGGRGEMLIRLNALFPIVNAKGEKIDEGALQRFLGEMVWFPSMVASPYITWEYVDDHMRGRR
jgi:hypothetical protein